MPRGRTLLAVAIGPLVAACGLSGLSDGAAGGAGDASVDADNTRPDAHFGVDGNGQDASSPGDASADAPLPMGDAAARFCALGAYAFCDDFDDADAGFLAKWTPQTSNGMLQPTAMAVTAPRALAASLSPGQTAHAVANVPLPTAKYFEVGFDLALDQIGGTTNDDASVAEVCILSGGPVFGVQLFALGGKNGGMTLSLENNCPGATNDRLDGTNLVGQYDRVTISIALDPGGGTPTLGVAASAAATPPAAADWVYDRPTQLLPSAPSSASASLNVGLYTEGTSSAWAVRIDDVAVTTR